MFLTFTTESRLFLCFLSLTSIWLVKEHQKKKKVHASNNINATLTNLSIYLNKVDISFVSAEVLTSWMQMSNCTILLVRFWSICSINLFTYGPGHAKTCLKPYANNKGADQTAHSSSLISTFVVRFIDSMICILAISKVSRFWLASVAEQAGLNVT